MPSKDAHVAAALHNQRVIEYLYERIDDFPDWVVTVAFYKALHVVEAVFAGDAKASSRHFDTHHDRNVELRKNKRYSNIWKGYGPLYQLSLNARYLREDGDGPKYEVFSKYMPPEKVQTTVLDHYLHQIEKTAAKLLKDPDFLEPADAASDSDE